MQTEPMFIAITKSGLTIKPQGSDLLLVLVKHCIKYLQDKIAEFQEVAPAGQEERAVVDAQRLLERTETLSGELEQVKGHFVQVYDRNFQMWAEAFRSARRALGLAKIEDSPHLYTQLQIVMKMLKEENPFFSREKFINYINA